jgi:hypothetical protein
MSVDRERAFAEMAVLVHARRILRAQGACVGTVHTRGLVDEHIAEVEGRLRRRCEPRLAGGS